MKGRPILPPEVRFAAKVSIDATGRGCWFWTAHRASSGYANFRVGRKADGTRRTVRAHRWAYEFFIGPIPEGLVLDHLCRNRACVNPDHLEPVTHRENLERGVGTLGARNAARTHCVNGHEFTEANTHRKYGWRQCRACDAARHRAKRLAGPVG